MSRTTALRAFLLGAPLAFAALLTQHPTGDGDLYATVSDNVGPWLAVHYGGALFFPLMALVVWLLIRGLSGRAVTIARVALPVYAVGYLVFEALFGIATGILANTGNHLSGAERQGVVEAVNDIAGSPMVGDPGVFVSVATLAWWVAISAAIMALKRVGVRPAALVLLGLGGLMTFHAILGPPALVCLSAAAYIIDRRGTCAPAEASRPATPGRRPGRAGDPALPGRRSG
jgi:hypothetical protein